MRYNKKGLSKWGLAFIVALVLFLLIIFFVVKAVVSKEGKDRLMGKYTLDLEISKVQITGNNSLIVLVKRGTGKGNITGIKFIVKDKSLEETIIEETSLDEFSSTTFLLQLNEANVSKLSKLTIYPLFDSESKEGIGSRKDEYTFTSSDLEKCAPYCPSGYECGYDGCGGECHGGCSGGYYCLERKCVMTLKEKCVQANLSLVNIVSNEDKENSDISITFYKDGDEEIDGLTFVFTDERSSSNFVTSVPGDIASFENSIVYVSVPRQNLDKPKKLRFLAYFVDFSGEKQTCELSEIFEF